MMAVKKRAPFARLLPGVMVVGFGLLVLNGSGLIHTAQAGIDQAPKNDAMATPASPEKDLAGDPAQASTASEVDVLTSLAKRRSELDAREAKIQNEANILAATETRVDAKIAQLQSLQAQMTKLLAQRDDEQEKQVQALVKTYSGMKGQDAARIFNDLPDEVLIPLAQSMKPDDLGQILKSMNPDAAQKLTVKLASRLTLPATNDAGSPASAPASLPAGAAPAPGSAAQAAAPAKPGSAAPAPAGAAPKTSG